ncbi:MAG TPA: hypothetical protein VGG19_01990 [Tepidisphaeraceae bacterium]|jgi:hypothetical protein
MAEQTIINCPGCGKRLKVPASLAGRNAKCPCGQSIPIPGASATAGAAPIGYRPVTKEPVNEEHSAVIKQGIFLSALLIVLVGVIFGVRKLGSSHAIAPPSLGDDAKIQKMIDEQNGTEAREWIDAVPGRMLSGMTISQAKRQIDSWYKLGAAKVYAFGGLMSLGVVLELPQDPVKRKALFDWVNDWNDRSFLPTVKDVGQKYLFVKLHL